jgi:hypothetical protein
MIQRFVDLDFSEDLDFEKKTEFTLAMTSWDKVSLLIILAANAILLLRLTIS